MTHEELKQRAFEAIDAVLADKSVENNKIDIKRQWYDLSNPNDEYEYAKDVSAIANTPGNTGMIIFGVDETERKLYSSRIGDQKLDSADLHNKIVKWVERPLNVELIEIDYNDTPISILAIPPTNAKPHFLALPKNVQLKGKPAQAVYIRKSSKNVLASREDLDLMLWDNRNVIPEYALKATSPHVILSRLTTDPLSGTKLTGTIAFENLGTRPVAIHDITLQYHHDKMDFEIKYNVHFLHQKVSAKLSEEPAIIPIGHIVSLKTCHFHGKHGMHFLEGILPTKKKMSDFRLELSLTSGKKLTVELECQGQEIINSVVQ